MPYSTEDYIHLPNPDHPESSFRLNNKGKINIVGTTNFGNGIKARMGLLKGSGKSAVYVYLFSTEKYTTETAKEWLETHRSKKSMKTDDLLNKKFQFTMPLIKGYEGDDGFYHIELGLSTTVPDLQGDELTKNALNDTVEELKKVQIVINDGHNHKLKDLIGPTTDAWVEDTDLFVDLRVRKKWEDEIKDLINSGTPLGGSIEGKATKTIHRKINGINKQLIDGVKLYGGALTDIPAAWNLRGSAREVKTCAGSMCTQIMKSLKEGLEVKNVTRNESDSYEALSSKIRAAINSKFSIGDRSRFWVRRTWPDAVVAESFDDDKLYEIPYSVNEDGEIELGEPKETTTQYVEKKTEFYRLMLKDVKIQRTEKRGDNLTKDLEIPEGIDLEKTEVEKIKSLPEKGKEFIKGLLGIEDSNDPEDGTEDPGSGPGTDPGGAGMQKDTMTKENVQKMIDKSTGELQKKVKTLEAENEQLKKDNAEIKKDKADETHKTLVNKALDLTKKLDEETEIKDEDSLMKHLEKDFTKEELEENPDSCIKTYNKGVEIALENIPDGPIPLLNDETVKKQADKYAEEAADVRKSLDEQGR